MNMDWFNKMSELSIKTSRGQRILDFIESGKWLPAPDPLNSLQSFNS